MNVGNERRSKDLLSLPSTPNISPSALFFNPGWQNHCYSCSILPCSWQLCPPLIQPSTVQSLTSVAPLFLLWRLSVLSFPIWWWKKSAIGHRSHNIALGESFWQPIAYILSFHCAAGSPISSFCHLNVGKERRCRDSLSHSLPPPYLSQRFIHQPGMAEPLL